MCAIFLIFCVFFKVMVLMFCFVLQSPLGTGLALAISHASHLLQPPPHQSIIIERMHSGSDVFYIYKFWYFLLPEIIDSCIVLSAGTSLHHNFFLMCAQTGNKDKLACS